MGLDNPLHILVIVVLLLLLFGAKRLPEIGRSLGTGMREFKQSVTGEATSHNHDAQPPGQQQASLPPATAQQAPMPAPAPQQTAPAPVPSSAQANPQDAFAQREQASGEQR
jgi:sec-independent protein translocase protein TatA